MYATILADSIHCETMDRLITYELEFPKIILPQVLTHRQFSRNTQSSRAVPVEKMIEQVLNNGYVPALLRENKSGMQAGDCLDDNSNELAKKHWLSARDHAIESARVMAENGVHKQWANRLLDPFINVKMVLTSSYDHGLHNFFDLRCNPAAQDEINELANMMYFAARDSKPVELALNQWHSPYSDNVKVSAGRCAEVSYRNSSDDDKALSLAERLVKMKHFSPFEHQALCVRADDKGMLNGNFPHGWWQHRGIIQYD